MSREVNHEIASYSVEDALNDIDLTSQEKVAETDKEETEIEAEAHEEQADVEDDATEELADEAESDESPTEDDVEEEAEDAQLEPLIAEAVKDKPEVLARLLQKEKGIQKLKSERNNLREELNTTSVKAQTLDQWNQSLFASNADHAAFAIKQILELAAKAHNTTVSGLLKYADVQISQPTDQYGNPIPDYLAQGYQSPKEQELEQKLNQVLSKFEAQNAEFERQRQENAKQAEQKKLVDEVAPRVIKTIEKLHNGFKITKADVAKALQEFPQLAKTPTKAVLALKAEELAKHYVKRSDTVSKPKSVGTPNVQAPSFQKSEKFDPMSFSVDDALATLTGM